MQHHCIKLVCMAVVQKKKPLLKIMQKKARKQFTEDKQTKDMDYWNHVLWSEETTINLFKCGSNQVRSTKTSVSCLQSSMVVGSVMFWDCMSAGGTEATVIEGTMNANMYCDILKQSMIPSPLETGAAGQYFNMITTTALLKKLRVSDGTAKHVSRPNPSEYLWGILKRKVEVKTLTAVC